MRRSVRAVLLVTLIGAVAACSSSGSSATSSSTTASGSSASSQGDGGITIYSGQHEQTTAALVKAFTKQTGIPAKVRSADEATLANQLLQEGSDSPADVFYAENPPALTVLDESHLLAPVTPATLQTVAATYRPTSGDWLGVSARAVALAYNTSKVAPSALPTSILDLAKPAWKGKVGFAPSETDFQPLITTIVKADGTAAAKQWLDGLKTNAKIYDSNESLVAAVNRGEVETGVIDHYYWYRLRDEVGASKLKTGLSYFKTGDPGSLVDVSGAAALRSSSHPKSAQAFLKFLVSAKAQQIIGTSESYEYPLADGVQSSKNLRPLAQFGASPASIAQLGDGKQALQLLQQAGLL